MYRFHPIDRIVLQPRLLQTCAYPTRLLTVRMVNERHHAILIYIKREPCATRPPNWTPVRFSCRIRTTLRSSGVHRKKGGETMKQRGIARHLAFLLFFLPVLSFSQDDAVKLAEGVYAIKGPGAAMNTGFVVGDRGVFVFACDLPDYDRRIQAIRSVAGGKPIRFVANGHHAGDDTMCNHLFAEQGAVVVGSKELARQLLPYWPKRAAQALKEGKVKREYLEGKSVEMAMPVLTFDDKITLDLGSHVVELISLGKTHTPDTTIVWASQGKNPVRRRPPFRRASPHGG